MNLQPLPNNDALSPQAATLMENWAVQFMNTIYQINSSVNPGFTIDNESVQHIRETVVTILRNLLGLKASNYLELDRKGEKIIPQSCHYMLKDAREHVDKNLSSKKSKFSFSKAHHPYSLMFSLVKECCHGREKEKRDRERERDIDRMAVYLSTFCESVVEDILKWTGNYVSNLRCGDAKINLLNLRIAISSDRQLLGLTRFMAVDEDDHVDHNMFLSQMCQFNVIEDQEEAPKVTYEAIAREFLKDERLFLRELKQLDVFRKRLYETCDDKNLLRMLFGNFTDLYELTTKIERLLEDSIEMSDTPCIGGNMWELSEACEFDSYFAYAMRGPDDEPEKPFMFAVERSINELLNNPKHSRIFEKAKENQVEKYIDGPTFRSIVRHVLPQLLQAPMVHFYHYLEYVSKLLDTSGTREDRAELQLSKAYLSKVGNRIERCIGQSMGLKELVTQDQESRKITSISQVARLREIESSIDGFEGNPIGKTCLELVKDGELVMVRPSYSGGLDTPLKGRWATSRYLYLFDQLIVLTKKHKTLKFKDRAATQLLEIVDLDDNTSGLQNAFRLEIFGKGSSVQRSYTFVCKTPEQKDSWLQAFVKTTTKSLIERQVNHNDKEEEKKYPLIPPTPEQYRFAEPDNEENITYEDYTTSSGVPVVKSATVLKLVERLTYHQYTDNKFIQTFLISYRSFCSPTDLLSLLIERFDIPLPQALQQTNRGGPIAGPYDTVQSHGLSNSRDFSVYSGLSFLRFRKEYERPIQRNVLSVLMQWVKNHWYDFSADPELLNSLQMFLQKMAWSTGMLTNQHKKYCRNILSTIDKQLAKNNVSEGQVNTAFDFDESATKKFKEPPIQNKFQEKPPEILWHTARQGDISNYDLLTLHPIEIGRQLTLLHFDLYRAVKPIELVDAAWTKHDKYVKSPQLLKLTDHATLLTYWVSRSIVESDSLEERTAMFARVIEVMSVFEQLHNFTGFVAFRAALHSAAVHRLESCKQKLSNDLTKRFDQLEMLCDQRWIALQTRIRNINPPCIPFFGQYLSNILFLQCGNKTFVSSPGTTSESPTDAGPKSPKKVLVSFLKCRRISEQIREIQMYQNQAYTFQTEPTIRQFFESINPKQDFDNNSDKLEDYLFERSKIVEPRKDTGQAPLDLRSKHPPHVLKSPGIKPPKASVSHSTTSFSTQTSTVPSTPSHDSDGPKSAQLLTPPGEEMVSQRISDFHEANGNKHSPALFGPLMPPPPVHPRKGKAVTPPALPMPFVSRRQPLSPPGGTPPSKSPSSTPKTPKTPNSARRAYDKPPAFVFPVVSDVRLKHQDFMPAPPLPAKPSRSSTSDELGTPMKPNRPSNVDDWASCAQVVLPKSTSDKEMTVSTVLPAPALAPPLPKSPIPPPPAPPPLPPRTKAPELPPKTYKQNYKGTTLRRPPPLYSLPTPPPPLPPKTFKMPQF